ncbi:ATP12 family chaperone protein [Novosphingobium sp.]|uniref:ATP12 family chaperone protein n=1 Tax=Novosphingobium sp. TaxID=1874826 RepID=UPI0025FE8C4F|nr:ATP12 family chaperone protein [Novosphingobium sp.]MCC6925008.1 molecular chaperone [Novosphingobium sp.]
MKRFWTAVAIAEADGAFQVTLDGRAVKTQGKRAQLVPSRPLAEALAAEWAAQGEEVDPARFVLRDLADLAIDVIAPDRGAAIAALLRYAETDTLCYRADPEDALHQRQAELWDPLLAAAEARWDVHFERVAGVIHRAQPAATLDRLQAVLAAESDFALAALTTLTALAASLVVGLAALQPDADAAALWQAAELEEAWQAELWGKDHEAEDRRARRFAAFSAALDFARLARG